MVNFAKIRAVILDIDGVIWKDQSPLGDLPLTFDLIKQLNWQFVFASNSSTNSVDHFIEKFNRFGVNLQSWQLVGSPEVTAHYLRKQYPQGGFVYIVGEQGLIQTLEKFGFYQSEQDVLAVVVGLDRQITYQKLAHATRLIRKGIPFIGTSPDLTYITPDGQAPGSGSIIAAVEAATDIHPLIMGKPGKAMYQVCLQRLEAEPEETLMIGDSLETDILGGQAIGCPTALVLSGVTTRERAYKWQPKIDWIGADLGTLIQNAFDDIHMEK